MNMVNRDIPEWLYTESRKVEIDGLVSLHVGKYEDAVKYFSEQLQLIIRSQEKEGRPIHKGGPLHNLGLSLFMQGKIDESIHYVLLAYIEDTLQFPIDSEDEADRSPAANLLRDVFKINLLILREIKSISFYMKKDAWDKIYEPQVILDKALVKLDFKGKSLKSLCAVEMYLTNIMPLGFPQPWETRVFIGTNYDTFFHMLPEIEGAVLRSGYNPVVVAELAIPEVYIHHHSLMLLHTCKYAIFEITNPAGQYMEIERLKDYEIPPLLLRSASSGDTSLPVWLSRMIMTAGYEVVSYRHISHLKEIVTDYLRLSYPGENRNFMVTPLTTKDSLFNVEILPSKIFNRGDIMTTKIHFKGEIVNGFFDNMITIPDGRICWNWDSKTLKDGSSDTKGELNGLIEVTSEWTWDIPKAYAPKGNYTISTRVYNHYDSGKRTIVKQHDTLIIIE